MRKSLTLALLMTSFFAKAQYHVADPTGDPPSTSHYYYANSGQIIDDTGATRPGILFYTENRTPNLFLAADRVSFAMRTIGNDTLSDSTHRIDMQFKCSSSGFMMSQEGW